MMNLFLRVAAVVVLCPVAAFGGFDVRIAPSEIRQGDAFIVKLTGVDSTLLTGNFGDRVLHFSRNGDGTAVALSFVGLEEGPGEYPVTVRHAGKKKTAVVKVMPIASRTIHLTLPENKVTLSPEDEERAEREILRMKSLWSDVSERRWTAPFARPVDGEISTEFGFLRIINGHKKSLHRGVDFRGAEGTPVRSINAGMVVLSANEFFGGNTVMVDHGDGLYSIYMHLQKSLVRAGQAVARGETVGLVGATGRATGPHLHLSVKYREMTVNPVSLIDLSFQ